MIFFNRIMDRMGYQAKDERFVREFIREQERVFQRIKYQYDGMRRYDQISTYYINPPREKYLRIKRLENVINTNSTIIKIKVQEDSILVMREE